MSGMRGESMANPIRKLLIAAPIGDGKEYSINEWFDWIANQTFKDYDVCLSVNATSAENLKKKVELLKQVEWIDVHGQKKKPKILAIPHGEWMTMKMRLSESREQIRKYAIYEGYSHVFWLDTDTIPLFKDAIPMLASKGKRVISGLYHYKRTSQPVVVDKETGTNISQEKVLRLMQEDEVCEVFGFGYGCVLQEVSTMNNATFDYKYKKEDWTEDFTMCQMLEENGIPRYFYARVACHHRHPSEYTINDAMMEQSHEDATRQDKDES